MPLSILSIQSHVAYGHVGNSAAVFPLQRLGAEVWPVQTVQFSSHAGYPGWQGRAFDAGMIDEVAAGLDAIGALARCDGLLTGYLGRVEIGEAALRVVAAVRAANSKSVYACDPVIGDTGKGVYVADGVPEFFRAAGAGVRGRQRVWRRRGDRRRWTTRTHDRRRPGGIRAAFAALRSRACLAPVRVRRNRLTLCVFP